MVVIHFSKTISQTMTSWELGLRLFEIRVILRGKSGFYGSNVLEIWSWRREVGHNQVKYKNIWADMFSRRLDVR